MQVIDGLGPQESKETYEYGYDHPYFGQIFLAASLSLVNFPDSLHPTVNLHSIEMLYLVPRILMGILAVVDTFLVYKIAETRYNRKIAFISATLFAVMPLSGILRGILLDSIELPFILLSILFAVYYAKYESQNGASNNNKKFLLVLISGIFLGLAIFTKVPVFTLIPLLAFIILQSNKKGGFWNVNRGYRLKTLALWFVPVVLIPMIWPAYALSVGQFGDWLDGVVYQAGRQGGRDLAYSLGTGNTDRSLSGSSRTCKCNLLCDKKGLFRYSVDCSIPGIFVFNRLGCLFSLEHTCAYTLHRIRYTD